MSDDADHEAIRAELEGAAGHLPLPPVPPDVSRRLRDAFRGSLLAIPAELLSDSRHSNALVGTRGSVDWSMSYRAGDLDVVLDLVPRGTDVRVGGQLLGPTTSADTTLRVFRDDELVSWGMTDEDGHFELGVVPYDVDTIAVSSSEYLIEIAVQLRPETG